MAFEDDYEFMMDNEDKNQLHAIVPDAPPGAHAISGINSAAFPKQFAAIATIPQAQRGPAVEQFYQAEFGNQWIAQITSADLQERVFDTAVNSGMGTAVKILQGAINTEPSVIDKTVPIPVDGIWGPLTVAAANACGTWLVPAFEQARVSHLRKYDANSPYLAQLIARAEK
jgi:lysozyme family protein